MAEQMWRVVAVFRVVTLAYAAVLIARDHAAPGQRGSLICELNVAGRVYMVGRPHTY
jgi:hypothetical protein